jgi:hypothetical protein
MTGPLLPHQRERGLGDVDNAEKIRLNLRTKFVEARIFDRADVAVPGIVNKHVEPPEGLSRYGHGMGSRLLVRHIKRNGSHLVAKSSTRSASCSGLRAVATSLSPAVSTASASARPRPRELPVINHI